MKRRCVPARRGVITQRTGASLHALLPCICVQILNFIFDPNKSFIASAIPMPVVSGGACGNCLSPALSALLRGAKACTGPHAGLPPLRRGHFRCWERGDPRSAGH